MNGSDEQPSLGSGPTARLTDPVDSTSPLTCLSDPQTPTSVAPLPAVQHGRARQLRGKLSERDLAVLGALHRLRLLRGDQVMRLCVADGSPSTQARRARALLKRLSDLGLIVRLSRSVGGVRAGSSGHVCGLSGLGQAVLAVNGPYGQRRRRVWDTKPHFQDHVLAVAELYVQLVEKEREEAIELLTFDAEPAAWRRFPGRGGMMVTLKPDAYIRIGIGEVERSAFIELDMGTESLPTVQRKCMVFIAYWQSGLEQQQHGVFPSVVWLVPNAERRDRLSGVIQRLAAEARYLFAVALQSDGPALLTAPVAGETA